MKKKAVSIILSLMLIFQTATAVNAEDIIKDVGSAEMISDGVIVDNGEAAFQSGGGTAVSEGVDGGTLWEELIIDEDISETDAAVTGNGSTDSGDMENSGSTEVDVDESQAGERQNGSENTDETEDMTGEAETDLVEEETETETEGLFEDVSGEDAQIIFETEIIELSDPTVVSDQLAGGISLFSLAQYDGCFGNQLSGFALELYNERVAYYVTDRNAGGKTFTRTLNTSPYTFEAELTGTGGINKETEEYKDFIAQVTFDMQSSLDAFLYDHPEVFWLRGGKYTMSIGASGSAGKGYTGYLSKITYTPDVAFSGADSLISAYDAAVSGVVSQIRSTAYHDVNGQTKALELAMAAHDYLCDRLYYDSASYANYETTKDYRIFSSAGAFLDSVGTGVVCEGYAKAFKVLCDNLGIPCILISGVVIQNGKQEGHMWNGVQIDGKWYLTDVTWDDGGSGKTYKYFMVGDITSGRTSSGNFSGSSLSMVFTYPGLQSESLGYEVHTLDNFESQVIAPTCTAQGYTVHICALCGISYKDSYTSLDHNYQQEVISPTCTAQGYTLYTCTMCGAAYTDNYVPVTHDYQESVVPATCTVQGYTLHTCTLCGDAYKDNYIPASHDYRGTVTPPTCTAGGYTTYTCSRCGSSYQADATAALGHQYASGGCTRCGIGDTIVKAAFSGIASQSYTGKGITPAITVSFGSNVLKQGIDYTVTYANNKNVGTATATITGKGKYTGTVKRTFKIVKKSVTALSYSSVGDKTYSGKDQKPSVTVRNGSVRLTKNKDYTITYSKNKNIGTAVITIKGKGSYTGTKKITFKILPKKTSLQKVTSGAKGKLTASWKKISGVSGYQIQYSLNSNFKSSKTVSVKSGASSRTISKLTGNKTYYVRIRAYKTVGGKRYYSAWSSAKKMKVRKK